MISRIDIGKFKSLRSEEKEVIAKKIIDNLTNNSCCILTTSSLTENDNERVITILKKLFERPLECKLKFASAEPLQAGFSPYGRSKALDTGIKNTLETWDINLSEPINFPIEMKDDWAFLINYQSRIFDLVSEFFQFLSFGINIKNNTFSNLLKRENGGIHFIHYLPYNDTFHPKARRQSKHVDMTLITVIPASDEKGLEVEIDGNWLPVSLKPNEFLIQVGKLLERMFGEKIKACLHTVETYDSVKLKHRYAFPFFASPSGETKINVIDKYSSEEIKVKYPEDFVKNINADYFSKIFKPDN